MQISTSLSNVSPLSSQSHLSSQPFMINVTLSQNSYPHPIVYEIFSPSEPKRLQRFQEIFFSICYPFLLQEWNVQRVFHHLFTLQIGHLGPRLLRLFFPLSLACWTHPLTWGPWKQPCHGTMPSGGRAVWQADATVTDRANWSNLSAGSNESCQQLVESIPLTAQGGLRNQC